jgi:hypothetical protein
MDSWILRVLIALAAMLAVGAVLWLTTSVAFDRVRNRQSNGRRTPET